MAQSPMGDPMDYTICKQDSAEDRKAIQDARLKTAKIPSYYIMTINMEGSKKTAEKVGSSTDKKVKEAVGPSTDKKVKEAVGPSTDKKVKEAVGPSTDKKVKEAVGPSTDKKVKEAVGPSTDKKVKEAVGPSTDKKVKEAVGPSTDKKVKEAVGPSTDKKVKEAKKVTMISSPRNDRVLLAKTITKNFFSSIIFCQETPGHFKRDFVDVIGIQGEYSHVPKSKSEHEAAVLWRTEDFDGTTDGLNTSDTTIIAIRDKVNKTYDASPLLSRIAMVKLTPRNSDVFSVLAVSWHGPHTGCTDKDRVLHGLLAFLKEVCKKEKIPSFIIGGDFNLNTQEVQLDKTVETNVVIPGYELSPRQKTKGGHGNYISYKDNFVFYSEDRKLNVIGTKPFEIEDPNDESTTSDLKEDYSNVQSDIDDKWKVAELLDHDPIIGVLQFGISVKTDEFTTSDLQEVTKDLSKDFEKCTVSDSRSTQQ
ncbi:hypothetical protein QZH41_002217 [Actinostola sp. cb2023]|nr:hypothetical protein QZH41_002217 [Actinostola sp. cb2023]